MPKASIAAARMELAHRRALEVVREHGPEERVENLENITVAAATTRNPVHLASFQAELIASLAEMVEVLMVDRTNAATAKKGAKKA